MIFFIYGFFIIVSFYLSILFNKKLNNYDLPGSDKHHLKKTLSSAGLFPNFIFIIFFIYLIYNPIDIFFSDYFNSIPRIIVIPIAALILTIVSFFDDYKMIPYQIRLLVQLITIFFAISAFPINQVYNFQLILFDGFLPLKIDLILSIFLWASIINVTNFIDGVDGMFSTQLIVLATGLGLHFLFLQQYFYLYICILLLIYGFVFIFFNFKKSNKTFIGDVGTIPMGFILGWLILSLSNMGYFFSALLIISYYLVDVGITLFIRIINKKSIFIRHNDFIFKKLFYKHGIKKMNFFIISINIILILFSLLLNDNFKI